MIAPGGCVSMPGPIRSRRPVGRKYFGDSINRSLHMGGFSKGMKWSIIPAAVAFAICGISLRDIPARAADAANPEGVKFFEAKIRPILAQTCVNCHGPDKQKGDLRMDRR